MLAIENVHDLEIALCASDQGSFSAAARELGITQPAVSQAVARLERQLGVTLFDRQESGHPEFVTDAGAVLLTHAIAALGELQGAVDDLAELAGGRALRVGLPSLLARAFFPDGLSGLAQAHQGHQTEIVLHDSEHLYDDLRQHRVDVGMIASASRGIVLPHITFNPVASYPLMVAVREQDKPSHDAISLASLSRAQVPVIVFSGDLDLRQSVNLLLQRTNHKLNVVAETDQPQMLWQLVSAGMGVGLASGLVFDGISQDLTLLQPTDATDIELNIFVFEDTTKARGPERKALTAIRQVLFAAVRERG